jgi:hypothetical protein
MNIYNTHVPFVYKWTEKSTGKWYIGSRTAKKCHPDDGYICSSDVVEPLIEGNPDNWNREILAIGNVQEMRLLETELLRSLDAKRDPMSYNKHNGDDKFFGAPCARKKCTHCDKMIDKRNHSTHEKTCSINPNRIDHVLKGRQKTDETRKKMHKPKSESHRVNISKSSNGKLKSESHRANMGDQSIYTFIHSVHGIMKCTRYEMRETYDIDQVSLSRLIHGRQYSTNGWRLVRTDQLESAPHEYGNKGKKHHSYDHAVYKFIHDSGVVEICTRYELKKKYDLGGSMLSMLAHGKRKSAYGWRLEKHE